LATFVPWVTPKLPAIPKAAVGAPRTTTAMPAAQSILMSRRRDLRPVVAGVAASVWPVLAGTWLAESADT
jgi:hypothetical protein